MSQTVLVCGASGGLGETVSRYFHDQGWRVFGTMRDPSGAGETPFPMLALDVTSDESASTCIREVIDQTGQIDVVINCFNNMTLGAVEECTMPELSAMFEVNVLGVMRMCKTVLPVMRTQGSGCIVNMSSLGGILAVPYLAGYTSAKFALEAFSEALYHEVRKDGIDIVIMQPVAMAMAREDTGDHLRLASGMTEVSPSRVMADRMAADTRESTLSPLAVAEKIFSTVNRDQKPLKVPMDRARPLGLVKRLAPQSVINRLIDGLVPRVHQTSQPASR